MESGRGSSRGTSSEEFEQQEYGKSKTSTRRSYGCTFCKMGFTNAQALGGHMNIHRKHRVKSKHISSPFLLSSSIKHDAHDPYSNSSYFMPVQDIRATEYHPALEMQRNYPTYFQPSVSSTVRHLNPHGYQRGVLMGDDLDAHSSSRISPSMQYQNLQNKGEELDLELRLGHNV